MAGTIEIKRLTIRDDRVVCELVVPDESRRYTNEALAKRIAERFPDLPGHSCANARGRNFGAVMACTSLPHLLEHLVIDLQASILAQDDALVQADAFARNDALVQADAFVQDDASTQAGLLSQDGDKGLDQGLEQRIDQGLEQRIDQGLNQNVSRETTLVGMTRWTDKKQGRARVEVSFTDDLVVLRAFREASEIINEVVLQ